MHYPVIPENARTLERWLVVERIEAAGYRRPRRPSCASPGLRRSAQAWRGAFYSVFRLAIEGEEHPLLENEITLLDHERGLTTVTIRGNVAS
jgi:hypothetical protein